MKLKLRRGVALLLCILVLSTILVGLTAGENDTVTADVDEELTGHLLRGTFRYDDKEDSFFYSDRFFSAPSSEKNEHLRTLSAAVAFAATGTSADNVTDLMTDIGMDAQSISVEDMVQGTDETIGTIIAHKEIDGIPLVLVAIRGHKYDGEWASSMHVGDDGDAAGISQAAEKVSERLLAYISEHQLENVKIWVCGYSRAGGTANLLGRKMNEDPSGYHTDKDDIYVYTFEAPRCSADDTVYENIHNIVDANDLIPYLCPEAWGLYLNGVAEPIGSDSDTVQTRFFDLSAENYIADYKVIPKSSFLKSFDDFIGTTVSRASYAEDTEQYACLLCKLYFSKGETERQELLDYLSAAGELIMDSPKLKSIFVRIMLKPLTDHNVDAVTKLVCDALDKARKTQEPPLTDQEYVTLKSCVEPLVRFLLTLADEDYMYKEQDENGFSTYYAFYHMVTFGTNIKELIEPHLNNNVFEQLKSEDDYYIIRSRINSLMPT